MQSAVNTPNANPGVAVTNASARPATPSTGLEMVMTSVECV